MTPLNLLVMLAKVKHTLQDEAADPSRTQADPKAIYQFKYDNAKVGGRFDHERPLRMYCVPPRGK